MRAECGSTDQAEVESGTTRILGQKNSLATLINKKSLLEYVSEVAQERELKRTATS